MTDPAAEIQAEPDAPPPPRAVRKRSVTIAGHRTSVSLEQAFWDALRRIAEARHASIAGLIAEIDAANGRLPSPERAANLSSALRVYVLEQARAGLLA